MDKIMDKKYIDELINRLNCRSAEQEMHGGLSAEAADRIKELYEQLVAAEKKVSESKIVIDLPNGYKLIAEQNTDPNYKNEIFVGITDGNGVWYQDLAVIRNRYEIDDKFQVHWSDDQFQVLVYADENNEDCTNEFDVGLYHGGV